MRSQPTGLSKLDHPRWRHISPSAQYTFPNHHFEHHGQSYVILLPNVPHVIPNWPAKSSQPKISVENVLRNSRSSIGWRDRRFVGLSPPHQAPPPQKVWGGEVGKEVGHLAQGLPGIVEGTDTLNLIIKMRSHPTGLKKSHMPVSYATTGEKRRIRIDAESPSAAVWPIIMVTAATPPPIY